MDLSESSLVNDTLLVVVNSPFNKGRHGFCLSSYMSKIKNFLYIPDDDKNSQTHLSLCFIKVFEVFLMYLKEKHFKV